MGKNIQLTISLLASDRLDTLPRCLDSIKPVMEAIPCELILVDTSKNPKVHELLLQYTDQVYEFEWCNDFSKARNVGLKKAKGEWFLFLDDDEWFVEIEPLIQFFKSGEYREYGCANYIVRNYYDKSYTYYSDSWVSRMIKVDKDTEFRSKIHEYLYPPKGKCKSLTLRVDHSGYVFATKEEKEKHFKRNSQLLLDMIEQEPDNLRWKMQLVQEYRAVDQWEVMLGYCEKYLKDAEEKRDSQDCVQIGTFYMGALEACINLKNYEAGIKWGICCLEDVRSTNLSKAMTYSQMAELYLRNEQYEESENCIRKYVEMKKLFEVKTADVLNQQGALLVGEAYDDTRWKKAHSILIICDLERNRTEYLKEYYSVLGWNESVIYAFTDIEKYILKAIAKLPYESIFSQVLTDAMKNKDLRRITFIEAQNWEEKNEKSFDKIMYAMSKAEGNDWYICYARVLIAHQEGNWEEVIPLLHQFYDVVPNMFASVEKISKVLQEEKLSVTEFYKKVSFDKWKLQLADFVSKANEAQIEELRYILQESELKNDVRYFFFEMHLALNKIMAAPQSIGELWGYRQNLEGYMEKALALYENYYRDEVFLEYTELLPAHVQAACWILKYLETEQSDMQQAFSHLRTAAKVYPALLGAVDCYINLFVAAEQVLNEKKLSVDTE